MTTESVLHVIYLRGEKLSMRHARMHVEANELANV